MKRSPIRQTSAKRDVENRKRQKMLKEKRDAGVGCEAQCSLQCTDTPDDGHEVFTRGRGGSISDPANVIMVCRPCHTEITDDPQWSDRNGFTVPSWVGMAGMNEARLAREAYQNMTEFVPYWEK